LTGASITGIALWFALRIREAIESSQLRLWEKERDMLHVTNCVTMTVSRKEPSQGTLRIRVGFIAAIPILNDLYAEPP
jgi:hypothetical protein